MQVNELMTRNAECIGPDATLHEAAVRMKALDVGSLPVCDNDRLVGMLTDRDIAMRSVADNRDANHMRVRDAMSVDSLDPCGVYFGTSGGQVYASPDGGDSWNAIVRDLPAVLSVEVQTLT